MKLGKLAPRIHAHAILFFLFSSLLCSGELPPLMQGENLGKLISESSDIVMICVYKKAWIPPVKGVSKGQLKYFSRVVSVLKGSRKVGNKILVDYNIEEAPSWLHEFESTVDGELKYIFFTKDNLIERDNGSYSFDGPSHFGFDFYDGSLTFLKEKIDASRKVPVERLPEK